MALERAVLEWVVLEQLALERVALEQLALEQAVSAPLQRVQPEGAPAPQGAEALEESLAQRAPVTAGHARKSCLAKPTWCSGCARKT